MDRLINATALLQNPVFIEVMHKIWTDVESQLLNCDATDLAKCQMLTITKQQVAMIERNIHNIISDERAKIQLERQKDKKLEPHIEWGKR